MTTPQDIQAAVDPSKEENWRYHDEYEFWYIEMPNTEIKTQRGDFTHGVGDRGFKPWELFQSHAIPRHNMNLNESVQAIGRKSKSKKFQSEVIGDLTILFDAPESCPSENTVFEKQDFLSSVDKNQKNAE